MKSTDTRRYEAFLGADNDVRRRRHTFTTDTGPKRRPECRQSDRAEAREAGIEISDANWPKWPVTHLPAENGLTQTGGGMSHRRSAVVSPKLYLPAEGDSVKRGENAGG